MKRSRSRPPGENSRVDVLALAGPAHAAFVDQQHARQDGMAAHQILGRQHGLVGARSSWCRGRGRAPPGRRPRRRREGRRPAESPRLDVALFMTPLLSRMRETSGKSGGSPAGCDFSGPLSSRLPWRNSRKNRRRRRVPALRAPCWSIRSASAPTRMRQRSALTPSRMIVAAWAARGRRLLDEASRALLGEPADVARPTASTTSMPIEATRARIWAISLAFIVSARCRSGPCASW